MWISVLMWTAMSLTWTRRFKHYYVESGYLDGESYENYVISVNVDMESGLAMTNSQILDIDDEFSIASETEARSKTGMWEGFPCFPTRISQICSTMTTA